jgi:tetratricopeptide (TPR) repeat protein
VHPLVANSLHNLATLYRDQGRYAEAEPLFQRALQIREQQFGPEHPETAETIHDLAVFQDMQGNSLNALSLYQRAFTIREQVFGSEHSKTKATHQRLSALRQLLNQKTSASQNYAPSGAKRAEHLKLRAKTGEKTWRPLH